MEHPDIVFRHVDLGVDRIQADLRHGKPADLVEHCVVCKDPLIGIHVYLEPVTRPSHPEHCCLACFASIAPSCKRAA